MRSAQFVLDHRITRRHLSAYLDGELAPAKRRRVERHLRECRDCHFTTRSLQRITADLALLRGCASSRLSGNVRDRLGDRMRATGNRRKRAPLV